MNVHTKLCNQRIANWIQENIKKVIHHDQVNFISEMQDDSTYIKINGLNPPYKLTEGQKPHDHLIRHTKDLWQNPTPLHNKSPEDNRDKNDIPQHNKGNVQQVANINLNRKKLKEFSLKLEQDKDTFSLHTYSIEYFNLS